MPSCIRPTNPWDILRYSRCLKNRMELHLAGKGARVSRSLRACAESRSERKCAMLSLLTQTRPRSTQLFIGSRLAGEQCKVVSEGGLSAHVA